MPTHEINMTIPSKLVLNKDAEFEVFSDGRRLGALKISKGTLEWLPSNHQYGYHLSWENFDLIVRENGSQAIKG